jgi:CBS domain-containing protein
VRVRTVVITRPEATVSEVAKRLIDNDINALPVVDDDGRVVGVISEALTELPLRGAW